MDCPAGRILGGSGSRMARIFVRGRDCLPSTATGWRLGVAFAGILGLGVGACASPSEVDRKTLLIEPSLAAMQPGDTVSMRVIWESDGTTRFVNSDELAFGVSDSTVLRIVDGHVVVARRNGIAHVWAAIMGHIAFADIRVGAAQRDAFSQLSAGGAHTCGLQLDGRAHCWGSHWFGEGGRGPLLGGEPRYASKPIAVAAALRFTSLHAGLQHTCGLTGPGIAFCWGSNFAGALGDGSQRNRDVPQRVSTNVRFRSLSAGSNLTCAIAVDGVAYCWGRLLDRISRIPSRVHVASLFRDISAGARHVCAISAEDVLFCWGDNSWGQLGIHTIAATATPVRVAHDIVAVTTGAYHTCVRARSGLQSCWGMNVSGQLGGHAISSVDQPSGNPIAFTRVDAGGQHTCGLTADQVLYCWGSDWRGQLGIGTDFSQPLAASDLRVFIPAPVVGGYRFAHVAPGFGEHTCAITVEASAFCWGSNSVGQLGTGNTELFLGTQLRLSSAPAPVLSISTVSK
jgi:hypothetical protein